MLSFLLSTSGFVITRHFCSHHSSEIVLGEFSDECCELEKVDVKKSCCESKNIAVKHSSDDCCQFEKNYIRLSVNYISSEKENYCQVMNAQTIHSVFDIFQPDETVKIPSQKIENHALEKIPKAKKYLLFHQVKVEPPLI